MLPHPELFGRLCILNLNNKKETNSKLYKSGASKHTQKLNTLQSHHGSVEVKKPLLILNTVRPLVELNKDAWLLIQRSVVFYFKQLCSIMQVNFFFIFITKTVCFKSATVVLHKHIAYAFSAFTVEVKCWLPTLKLKSCSEK